jgi:hypothetical protein
MFCGGRGARAIPYEYYTGDGPTGWTIDSKRDLGYPGITVALPPEP